MLSWPEEACVDVLEQLWFYFNANNYLLLHCSESAPPAVVADRRPGMVVPGAGVHKDTGKPLGPSPFVWFSPLDASSTGTSSTVIIG